MGKIRQFWHSLFDIRPGEGLRVLFMSLYLLLVLFAYYILKPVSRAMFLDRFDIDDLPYLYIVIAFAAGILAYLYTKVAVKSSLQNAVTWATAILVGTLVLIWWLLRSKYWWMNYVLNVFVSLFSIMLVSQGWLIAANVFNPREAKRLYSLLGVSAVIGATFGGEFTRIVVKLIGPLNLLLASAGIVVLAYLAFRALLLLEDVSLAGAKAAENEEKFSFKDDIWHSISGSRHLQIIIAIISITYVVDTIVDFQFSAMAKERYPDDVIQLTAFFASFYGLWLNGVTFVFQLFLTAFVVSRFGVGGALQIMPVSISLASLGGLLWPGLLSAAATRLTEAATRYSFNRTGMELLYLPLPADLRNRTKAFVDVSVDRLARGIGGMLLLLLVTILNLPTRYLPAVVLVFSIVWIFLSIRARNEYVTTVRKRISSRRLDLETARVSVSDPAMLTLLEHTAQEALPRQARYALTLLADAPNYNAEPLLDQLVNHLSPEVRAQVFAVAQQKGIAKYVSQALAELRQARTGDDSPVIEPAVQYALAITTDKHDLAARLLEHDNYHVAKGVIQALAGYKEVAADLFNREWLDRNGRNPSPNRRALAAAAVGVRGDEGTEVLHSLLEDREPLVLEAAIRSAGTLHTRSYLMPLLGHLASGRLRGIAISSLASYGTLVVGTLGDFLLDEAMPLAMRRQIPRVLQAIPDQRAVDTLLGVIEHPNLTLRAAILRALNRMREKHPGLQYGSASLHTLIHNEARYYFEMTAALATLRQSPSGTPTRLLVSTLEERLRLSLRRLFALLGLEYPPREIDAAYQALRGGKGEQYTTALEFLDNLLERELKSYVLPLLDDEAQVVQKGRDLFGVEEKSMPTALRELMRSGDPWLASCAIAVAADLRLHEMRDEIQKLTRDTGNEVAPVAEKALTMLA